MTGEELASDPSAFWTRRHELQVQPTTRADLSDRATDGERHLVLLWDLSATDSGALDEVRDRLEAFECLAVAPLRYLHVTVKVLGDTASGPDGGEAFQSRDRRALADAVGDALDGVDSFTVRLRRLNLFPTVVYCEVEDGGWFAALNDRVCAVPGIPIDDRDRQFIPHAALADFVGTSDYASLVGALETDREVGVGPVEVTALDLASVDLGDRFPRFETVRRYDLG